MNRSRRGSQWVLADYGGKFVEKWVLSLEWNSGKCGGWRKVWYESRVWTGKYVIIRRVTDTNLMKWDKKLIPKILSRSPEKKDFDERLTIFVKEQSHDYACGSLKGLYVWLDRSFIFTARRYCEMRYLLQRFYLSHWCTPLKPTCR